MSFKFVEDTKDHPIQWFTRGNGSRQPAAYVRHSIWRCENCKALAVGPLKSPPPKACGKCRR